MPQVWASYARTMGIAAGNKTTLKGLTARFSRIRPELGQIICPDGVLFMKIACFQRKKLIFAY